MNEIRSPVYGPVLSWRYGNSLGVDLLLQTSICSFNCVYCQLGEIQRITQERKVYVPTPQVTLALERTDWGPVDLVTFSGSGEPTLALNLGEVIHHVQSTYEKPVMILTNATGFQDSDIRRNVMEADIVACKLDCASDAMLQKFNRPADGITMESILEGIRALRKEYQGQLHLQCMFMPLNRSEGKALTEVISSLKPDLVQLNTPRRPYPRAWYLGSRGSHGGEKAPVEESNLRTLSRESAEELATMIKATGVQVQSVFDKETD